MIRAIFRAYLNAAVLVLLPAATFANQLEFNWGRGDPRTSIEAGGGSADPAGSRGDLWSADFLHPVQPSLYIGVGGGHFRSDDNVSATWVPNTLSTLDSKMTSILLLGRMDLMPSSRWTPYLMAGIGWTRISLDVASQQQTLLDDSKNAFGYAGGVGIDYWLTDRLFLGVEGRYQGSLKQTFQLTPAGVDATGQSSLDVAFKVISLTLKAGFKY